MSASTFDNSYRSHWCGLVGPEQVGQRIRAAGWVHRRRDHGGLIFIDLRDREGLLQLVFRPDDAPEAHAAAHRLRPEHVVSATGTLIEREEGRSTPTCPRARWSSTWPSSTCWPPPRRRRSRSTRTTRWPRS
ncbi:MAG: OB-fold nucleic acid binding domain-containing protein [Thermoleophilaceae bacterium]